MSGSSRFRGKRGPAPTQPPIVRGGIYWVDDERLALPPWLPLRKPHPRRPVIVISPDELNHDDSWPFVVVVPTSTEPANNTRYCFELTQPSAKGEPVFRSESAAAGIHRSSCSWYPDGGRAYPCRASGRTVRGERRDPRPRRSRPSPMTSPRPVPAGRGLFVARR